MTFSFNLIGEADEKKQQEIMADLRKLIAKHKTKIDLALWRTPQADLLLTEGE